MVELWSQQSILISFLYRIIYLHHFHQSSHWIPSRYDQSCSRFIYINLNSTEFIFLLEPC